MDYLHPLEKAIIQGATTGIFTCIYYGSDARAVIPYIGATNLCYVGAGVGAISSIINDVAHSYIKEEIPIREKANDQMSVAVGVGIGALVYNYVLFLANPNLARDTGIIANSVIGGGGEFAGSFLYNLFLGD